MTPAQSESRNSDLMATTKKAKPPARTAAPKKKQSAAAVAEASGSATVAKATPAAKKRASRPRSSAPEGPSGQALVIVESPTKAKSIGKYLGRGYDVKATVGHIRDLPTRKLGVDVDNNFEPQYVTIKGKTQTLADLKKAAKRASAIYLATDPDREGEALPGTSPASSRPRRRCTGCASRRLPKRR